MDSVADVAVYPYQTYCKSKYETVWTGMMYGYKARFPSAILHLFSLGNP